MENNFTLLYLEDDDVIRENFSEIFKTYFGTVLSTSNGDEALKIFKNNAIDIAILDVNVHGLDGISVATQLREEKDEEELIILMISSYSDREKLLRAINLQLFAYLIKPVKSKELYTVLDNIVQTLHKQTTISLNGSYVWNRDKKTLLYQDKEVKLTKYEKVIINILLDNKNSYMSACDIQEKTAKESEEKNCSNIVQLLSRLKKKMNGLNESSEYFIENCYGIGYRITVK
jgi:DNA-binding response OmpR family regulator